VAGDGDADEDVAAGDGDADEDAVAGCGDADEDVAARGGDVDEDAVAGGGDADEDVAARGGDVDEDAVAGDGDADENAEAGGEIVGASAESDVFISCPYVSLSKRLALAIPSVSPAQAVRIMRLIIRHWRLCPLDRQRGAVLTERRHRVRTSPSDLCRGG